MTEDEKNPLLSKPPLPLPIPFFIDGSVTRPGGDYVPGQPWENYQRKLREESEVTGKARRSSDKILSQIKEETSSSSSSNEIPATKEISDTSSSSTSEYEAYVVPSRQETAAGGGVGCDDDVEAGGKSNYQYNLYRLNDCSLVKTQGLSYQEIVEEHLSTNPSLETSKSSVELEKAIRAESFSVKNEKSEFSSVRNNGAGDKTNNNWDSAEKLVKADTDKNPSVQTESQYQSNLDVNLMAGAAGARPGVDVGDVDLARDHQQSSSMTIQSQSQKIEQRQIKISGLNRNEEWIQEHLQQQGSQTFSQTAGGVTTSTSTTTNYENTNTSQQSHIKDDSHFNDNHQHNNINNNIKQDNSLSSDQSEDSSEMVVVAAVEKTQEDKMSYVSSAKEKEKKTGAMAPDIRTSVVSGQFNYKDFLSGVEDITVRGEREDVVGLTSTPRDSVRGRAEVVVEVGGVTSPRESTSSSMSNEEIVRSHLGKLTQVNIREGCRANYQLSLDC